MPFDIKKLRIVIEGDTTSLDKAEKDVQKFSDTSTKQLGATESSFKSVTTALSFLKASIAGIVLDKIVQLGKTAFDTRARFEALEMGLRAVTKDTGSLSDQLERLREVAKLPGLGFEEAVQGSVRLQAATFSAREAERYLKSFGNAIATVGGGKEQLDGVTLALAQMAAKTHVQAEEINQLAERLPQIRAAMLEAFGTADTELIQKAGIAPKAAIDALSQVLEKAKSVEGGLKNSAENIGDAMNQLFNNIGKSAQESGAFDAIDGLTELLNKANENARKVIAYTTLLRAAERAGSGAALGKVDDIAGLRKVMEGQITLFERQLTEQRANVSPYLPQADVLEKRIDSLRTTLRGLEISAQMAGVSLSSMAGGGKLIIDVTALAHAADTAKAAIQSMGEAENKAALDRANVAAKSAIGKASPGAQGSLLVALGQEYAQDLKKITEKQQEDWAKHLENLAEMTKQMKDKIFDFQHKDDPFAIEAKKLRDEVAEYIADGGVLKVAEEALSDGLATIHQKRWEHLHKIADEHQKKMIADGKKAAKEFQDTVLPFVLAATDFASGGALEAGKRAVEQVASAEETLRDQRNQLIDSTQHARIETLLMVAADEKHRVALQELGIAYEDVNASLIPYIDSQARWIEGQKAIKEYLKELPSLIKFASDIGPLLGAGLTMGQVTNSVPRGQSTKDTKKDLDTLHKRIENVASQLSSPIQDAVYAGLNGGNAVAVFRDKMKQSLTSMFSELIGNQVKNLLKDAFTSLTDQMNASLMESMGGMKAIMRQIASFMHAETSSLLGAAYAVIAAMSRHKQGGIGSILGAIGGLVLSGGNPMGAIAGYNVGNAIDNGDYTGALIGTVTGYTSGDFTKASGPSGSAGGWTSEGELPSGRAVAIVNYNHHGDVNNLGGMDRMQDNITESVRTGLMALA